MDGGETGKREQYEDPQYVIKVRVGKLMDESKSIVDTIIAYCKSRINEQLPLNSKEWVLGYTYALKRVIEIAESGEERKKSDIKLIEGEIREYRTELANIDRRKEQIYYEIEDRIRQLHQLKKEQE